jgi:hypothetical protein
MELKRNSTAAPKRKFNTKTASSTKVPKGPEISLSANMRPSKAVFDLIAEQELKIRFRPLPDQPPSESFIHNIDFPGLDYVENEDDEEGLASKIKKELDFVKRAIDKELGSSPKQFRVKGFILTEKGIVYQFSSTVERGEDLRMFCTTGEKIVSIPAIKEEEEEEFEPDPVQNESKKKKPTEEQPVQVNVSIKKEEEEEEGDSEEPSIPDEDPTENAKKMKIDMNSYASWKQRIEGNDVGSFDYILANSSKDCRDNIKHWKKITHKTTSFADSYYKLYIELLNYFANADDSLAQHIEQQYLSAYSFFSEWHPKRKDMAELGPVYFVGIIEYLPQSEEEQKILSKLPLIERIRVQFITGKDFENSETQEEFTDYVIGMPFTEFFSSFETQDKPDEQKIFFAHNTPPFV